MGPDCRVNAPFGMAAENQDTFLLDKPGQLRDRVQQYGFSRFLDLNFAACNKAVTIPDFLRHDNPAETIQRGFHVSTLNTIIQWQLAYVNGNRRRDRHSVPGRRAAGIEGVTVVDFSLSLISHTFTGGFLDVTAADARDGGDVVKRVMAELGSTCVAFSGGVDSSVFLALAVEPLGAERVLALTTVSELTTGRDIRSAKDIAFLRGVQYLALDLPILGNDRLRATGQRSADELGVRGLSNWDHPSAACLASRIPLCDSPVPAGARADRRGVEGPGMGVRGARHAGISHGKHERGAQMSDPALSNFAPLDFSRRSRKAVSEIILADRKTAEQSIAHCEGIPGKDRQGHSQQGPAGSGRPHRFVIRPASCGRADPCLPYNRHPHARHLGHAPGL